MTWRLGFALLAATACASLPDAPGIDTPPTDDVGPDTDAPVDSDPAVDTDPSVDTEIPPDSPTPRMAVPGELATILSGPWCVTRTWSPSAQHLVFLAPDAGTFHVVPVPLAPGTGTPTALARTPDGFVFGDATTLDLYDPFARTGRQAPTLSPHVRLVAGDGTGLFGVHDPGGASNRSVVSWPGFGALVTDWRDSTSPFAGGDGPATVDGPLLAVLPHVVPRLRRFDLTTGQLLDELELEPVPGAEEAGGLALAGSRVLALHGQSLPFADGDAWLVSRDRATGAYVDGLLIPLGDAAPGPGGDVVGLWCEDGGEVPELSTDAPVVELPLPFVASDPCSGGAAAWVGRRAVRRVAEAVAASVPGDVVRVCPGRWPLVTPSMQPSFHHLGPVTVRSVDGDPTTTVLTGEGRGRILRLAADAQVRLEGLGFEDGLAEGFQGAGGAVIAFDVEALEVFGCRFAGNEAEGGGGAVAATTQAASLTARLSFTNVLFEDNVSRDSGGAAMLLARPPSTGKPNCTLNLVTFARNFATNNGGALELAAGGAGQSIALTSCAFTANAAGYGGGALLVNAIGNVEIADTTFEDHVAGFDAGAIQFGLFDFPTTMLLRGGRVVRSQSGAGAAIQVEDGARLVIEDVDLGDGVDDNAPRDVLGCPAEFGPGSSFVLDLRQLLRCR